MNNNLERNFRHLRSLAGDIESRLQGTSAVEQRLKNELAGMFAVTIAATYESIIKDCLMSYASSVHPQYGAHIEKDFEKLNARVSLDHLKGYSVLFGLPEMPHPQNKKSKYTSFHKLLEKRKSVVERRFRTDMFANYRNIFVWRNDYAHERTTSATFADVYGSHRVAQYVIRAFVTSFEPSN